MSLSHVAPSHDAYGQAKRRKVRKGTHSCWECKRRKMKCRFDPRIASACNGCRRRGSPCISQEFPEDLEEAVMNIGTTSSDGTPFDGRTRATTPSERTDQILTPVSTVREPSQYPRSPEQHLPTGNDTSQRKYERLSRFLHELLPSRADRESIFKASRHSSILSHELLTTPYITLHQNGLQTPESLLMTPQPNSHPVLIARYMLQFALFLQHLPPDLYKEIQGLSEPPRATMERLADAAIYHVTTNEALINSIESLECIMLESLYQVNLGNLRRSWVAGRRAMSLAQFMGFHRPDNQTRYYKALDPKTNYDPQIMWLRIIILDRQLCLLLGLPEGCTDHTMASSETRIANNCPMGRLEQLHCVAMSRILDRNASQPSGRDLTATRAIDLELQKAAGSLPSKWWLAPKLDSASTDLQAMFWDTRRLVLQICHYNLLNQLHLPYMLRPSTAGNKYEYSRITCVNASREVLSRYNSLRSFNRIAYSCRTVDFLALMAAMALLLAHMDSYRDGAENLLANQYLSDRGMIEQVQEHMSEINRLNSDELSAQSADLLKSLLAIDLEKGKGRVSVREAGSEGMLPQDGMGPEEESVVRVHIPYFGIIRIAREKQHATTASKPPVDRSPSSNSDAQLRFSTLTHPSNALPLSPNTTSNPLSFAVADAAAPHEFTTPFAHQQQQPCQPTFSNPGLSLTPSPLMQGGYPDLAAGSEDWAFQRVDMAFFESIMRNVGGDL
uniref:Dehydrocurvularin biosynthesis regulator n=1 Tax=Aspergillus terreus TaxID=33178 RepID=CURR_ASPTE|nr:RecName: Full=Dehydrocurvularin biosynthesis regulator [Aspergillus terreus]AGC95322.1 CurR [Aspergillus terreus]